MSEKLNAKIHVLLGAERSTLPAEREYLNPVDTEIAQATHFLIHGVQQAQVSGTVPEHRSRMRPECQNKTLLPARSGASEQSLYNIPVSQMDTVKKAGSRYSHFTTGKS